MVKRMSVLFVGTVLAMCVLFGSCKKGEKVIARVGSVKITESTLNEKLLDLPIEDQKRARTPSGRKIFIDKIVKEVRYIEAAKKAGTDKDQRYKDMQKQFNIWESALLVNLYVSKIRESIEPTDADIQKYYDANKAKFEKRMAYNIQLIIVSNLQAAQNVLARLQKNENFAEVAKAVSLDKESAVKGGSKQFESGTYPVIEKEIANLSPGQISKIFETLDENGTVLYSIARLVSKETLPKNVITETSKNEIKRILQRELAVSIVEKDVDSIKTEILEK
ncbi:MAG: peptidyl-prolyl cis-trans isomerase [Endomicrobium sp.]|nr:peptidyl-prolyl cis-trans isomerase [Endomicrobium sp.]